MMFKVAFLVLVNFALIQAKKKGGCCIPSQWEGYEGVTTGYLKDGKGGSVQGYIKVAYDAGNQKVAADSTMFIDGRQERAKVIMDYEKKVQYVVYRGHCNTTKLETPFPEGCIPADAKEVDVTHLGTGQNSLDVTIYEVVVKGIYASITVTSDGCVPVGELLQGSYKGVSFMENVGYVGIKDEISDPSVFDPPRICSQKVPYTEARRHYNHKSPVLRHYSGAVPHHIERFMSKSAFLGF